MSDLIHALQSYLPELSIPELQNALKIVSKESGISEDGLINLCILNAVFGGLVVGGCGENGTDAIAFLRNVWRKFSRDKTK